PVHSTAAHTLHFSLYEYLFRPHVYPLSFPTRRSSDLAHRGRRTPAGGGDRARAALLGDVRGRVREEAARGVRRAARRGAGTALGDRKSTRLNSSHGSISYAVFCLKKKNGRWQRMER